MKAKTVAPPAPELEVTITMTHAEATTLVSLAPKLNHLMWSLSVGEADVLADLYAILSETL